MSSFPSGWATIRLAEITTKIGSGATPTGGKTSYQTLGIPLIRSMNVHFAGFTDEGLAYLSAEQAKKLDAVVVKACDVLLNITGASIGRVTTAPPNMQGARVNQHVAIIRTVDGIEPEFVCGFLASPTMQGIIANENYGVTRQALTKSMIEDFCIPVPPLPEQRRVVAQIKSLSSKSKRARDQLDHVSRLVKRYKQAILTAEFSRAADGGTPVALSEAIASTFYGPRFAKEAYESGGIVTLRTTDFDEDGNIKLKSPPSVRVSNSDFTKWGLVDGDLLVTRTGSIGKCAIYTEAIGPALPSAYLIRVRLKLERIRPRYALLFLLSDGGQEQLGLGITAVTQPNINAGVIERLRLPIPNIETQDLAIRRIERAFNWIDRLASEATSARKLIDHLGQAVLAKAFQGELVPQDPSDEPASVLLERIKAEREAASTLHRRPHDERLRDHLSP
jgi:type I restriction enzyme S subunit